MRRGGTSAALAVRQPPHRGNLSGPMSARIDPLLDLGRVCVGLDGSRPLEWCMGYLLSCDCFVLAGRVGVT
jgi:hypothetical protein